MQSDPTGRGNCVRFRSILFGESKPRAEVDGRSRLTLLSQPRGFLGGVTPEKATRPLDMRAKLKSPIQGYLLQAEASNARIIVHVVEILLDDRRTGA